MSFTFPARYEPCRRLGTGGGGEVWEVKDRYTSQPYALKFLAENATEHEMEALVREATALSGLEGLGVPRVLRFGRLAQNGRAYMVRELIEGQSLEALISGSAPTRVCLQALAQSAEQLTLLHRAGFFHGDVKPANIIVGDRARVTLVDLGLAAPWRDAGITAPGLTPRYAAPELLGGKPLTVRAEIYALGVACREVVERGERSLNAALIRDLLLVAQCATAVEPEQRYPSADEFANALRRAAGIERPNQDENTALIWPIVGVESTAGRLLQQVRRLEKGTCLELRGAHGSGRSVLLRRLAWSLGVDGYPLIWVDHESLRIDVVRAEIQAVAPQQPLLLVDDVERVGEDVRRVLLEAKDAGATVVAVGELQAGSQVFEVPPLGEATATDLLRRSVPSLTDRVAKMIVDRTAGLPGSLRQFVVLLAERTVASDADVEELLASLEGVASEGLLVADPLQRTQLLLARGRYGEARAALEEVKKGDPVAIAVARARLWVGLGDGQEALNALDAVAEIVTAQRGSPEADSYYAWRARALVAVARYADALQVLKDDGPTRGPAGAEAFAFAGLAHTHVGDEASAKVAITRAINLAREIGDTRVEGVALACMGLVLQRSQSEVEEARAAYEQALVCAQNASDAGTIGTVQLNLAVLLKVRGDVARAIELYEAAADMGRRSGRRGTVRSALLGLANADLYLGRLARARTSIEALEQQRESLPVVSQAALLGLQAELFARSGEIPDAVKAYQECAAAFERIGKTMDAAEARLESVLVRAQAPDPDVTTLKVDLDYARTQLVDSHAHRALVCTAVARVCSLQGDERGARSSLDEGLVASREATQLEWTWQILAARAELEERSGQYLMARRDRIEAVTVLEEIASRLPRDLREVFWNDPRRRALRAQVTISLSSAETHMAPSSLTYDAATSGRSKISGLASTLLEQRLARILEINRELLGELDIDRLSTRVIEVAVELVRAQRGFVILRDDEGGGLSVRSATTRGGDAEHQQFSRSIAERVIRSGEPFTCLNARDDHRIREFASVHRFHLEAVACVPIVARLQDPIGALYVESRKVGAAFQIEVPTLQAFADQVALAIETARLVAENRRRATELAKANQELRKTQESLQELLGERTEKLKAARQKLRETEDALLGHFGYQDIVGTSERMRRCYSLIDRVKDTDVPVLITGESGTGKEIAARALHRASERAKLPFLGVNCGAIPEHLLESELFGHVRGAFTGADRDRKGLLREAQGGTVLLDEIGEMPQKMQAGLLRVLQERKVRPVGGAAEEPVHCRFVFATHRNLLELVEAGRFREDLYYRIHVVELPLPPLRERLDDVPLLVDHFFGIFAARHKRERKTITKAALRALAGYTWPGNVRQLEHVLLNAWVLTDSQEVDADDLELPVALTRPSIAAKSSERSSVPENEVPIRSQPPEPQSRPSVPPRRETISSHRRSEKDRIIDALEACNWNRVKAAELSGIPRRTFYRRLREYNIQ